MSQHADERVLGDVALRAVRTTYVHCEILLHVCTGTVGSAPPWSSGIGTTPGLINLPSFLPSFPRPARSMRSISSRAQRSGSLVALSDCNSQARRACLTIPTSIRSTARRRTRETMWVCAASQPRTRRARRTGAHPCMHEHHLAHSGHVPASIPRFRHKLESRWLAIVSCSRTSLHDLIISFSDLSLDYPRKS
jgi:hypothetical protein